MMLKVIKQYEYESESWKRVLGFIQEECINFKKRLSDILKYEVSAELLDRAEYFQHKFITHDELIRLLYDEVFSQERILEKEERVDGEKVGAIVKAQRRIRNEIKTEEEQFGKLREEFNYYVLENILETG